MIELRAGDLRACFAPEAGLVGSSLTHRGEELLGQRGGLEAWVERGKTFGIPLLHPWANRLSEAPDSPLVRRDEHGSAIHGLLHGRAEWSVVRATDDHLLAALDFEAREDWLAAFPFPHQLEAEVTLDEGGLTHALTVRSTGSAPVPVAFGLHPYLRLPGVPRAEWELSTSVRSRLRLDARGLPTGEVDDEPVADGPLGDRAFDHAYRGADRARFALSGGGRRLEIRFLSGYTHAQLFAPPGEGLVAFEPMTAPADALRTRDGLREVPPGGMFRAVFRIGVRPLGA